ncbi:hypothetical protein FN846DRAFT_507376 [Sphaerosporella brunnea]|uniref:Uncharacterized protein n=1 Tax=Sphaerosporella brunnea TaxID=1250544 RepID=A0A5J5F3T5_9PEZI|nr:hypothetical protein FN846DRAFT_507376 [Sphaerosporella brunnea]
MRFLDEKERKKGERLEMGFGLLNGLEAALFGTLSSTRAVAHPFPYAHVCMNVASFAAELLPASPQVPCLCLRPRSARWAKPNCWKRFTAFCHCSQATMHPPSHPSISHTPPAWPLCFCCCSASLPAPAPFHNSIIPFSSSLRSLSYTPTLASRSLSLSSSDSKFIPPFDSTFPSPVRSLAVYCQHDKLHHPPPVFLAQRTTNDPFAPPNIPNNINPPPPPKKNTNSRKERLAHRLLRPTTPLSSTF